MSIAMPQRLPEGAEVVVIQTRPSTPMQLLTTGSPMQVRAGFGTVTNVDAETGKVSVKVDPAFRTHADLDTFVATWSESGWVGGQDTIAPRDLEMFAGKDLDTIHAEMIEKSMAALPPNVQGMLAKLAKAKKS